MCEKGTFPCQKGAFAGGRGAVIGEKALFRDRRASLLEGGAPYLLRRAPSWAKGAPFPIRRVTLLAGSHPYNVFGVKIRQWLRHSRMETKIGAPAPSAHGCEFSFPAAIFISLCQRRPCAFGAGAPVSIGEGLPAPAAPLWIRH